jgi:hypothetical protein
MTWWTVGYVAFGFLYVGYIDKDLDVTSSAAVTLFFAVIWPLVLLVQWGSYVRRLNDQQD